MNRVLLHSLPPTARAVTWTPMLAAAAGLLATAALLRAQDATSPVVLALGVGAMAAAMTISLRDPAAALLAAVPVTRAARRLMRLAVACAVAVPLWLAVASLLPGPGTALGSLGALVATGLAVATWLPADRGVMPAAAVPLVWVAAAELLGGLPGPVDGALHAWSSHPASVTAAGLLLFALGRHR